MQYKIVDGNNIVLWEGRNEKDILPSLFSIIVQCKDLEYWSLHALREALLIIATMVEENLTNIGILLQRRLNKLKRLSKVGDTEEIIYYIWDIVLTSQGLSTLSGFGAAVCEIKEGGGKRLKRYLGINPEKTLLK